MNSQMSANSIESEKNTLRINILLNKLKRKLTNFAVLDRSGFPVGQVQDIKLDAARQLNLVISETDTYQEPHLFFLRSSHIQQVDSANKSLFVDVSKIEITRSSEYLQSEPPTLEVSEPSVERTSMSPDTIGQAEEEYKEQFAGDASLEFSEPLDVVEEEVIRLLEERLIVDVTKRKVGEVIVRKEIVTRMVEVPVHYEKLIVEQISPERKQLAEINLGEENIPDFELSQPATTSIENQPTVSGEFTSLKTASLLLDAIAMQRQNGCKKVRIEIVLENEAQQKTYQEWFERCTADQGK